MERKRYIYIYIERENYIILKRDVIVKHSFIHFIILFLLYYYIIIIVLFINYQLIDDLQI